jgi:hypothetical protein
MPMVLYSCGNLHSVQIYFVSTRDLGPYPANSEKRAHLCFERFGRYMIPIWDKRRLHAGNIGLINVSYMEQILDSNMVQMCFACGTI